MLDIISDEDLMGIYGNNPEDLRRMCILLTVDFQIEEEDAVKNMVN